MMLDWSMGFEGWLWLGTWILVLGVLVWFLVREPRHAEHDDALEILRDRLARGEITTDEFEHARQLLDT